MKGVICIEFLAKTNPPETIVEHTQQLIKRFYQLKELYQNKIDIDWDALFYAVKWHDIGKINTQFQDKLETGNRIDDELYHNFVSAILMNPQYIKQYYIEKGFDKKEAIIKTKALVYAVGEHHYRELNQKYTIGDKPKDELKQILANMQENIAAFPFELLDIDRSTINTKVNYSKLYKLPVGQHQRPKIDDSFYNEFIKLKGFLNKIDYAASGHYPVEYPPGFLSEKLEHWINENDVDLRDVQQYAKDQTGKNTVFIAQTGIGKTEAALLWAGDNKTFFTLPLQAAINNIYDRIIHNFSANYQTEVAILHNNAANQIQKTNKTSQLTAFNHRQINKQLNKPLTITTLDQIFKFVYKYRNYEPLLMTLSYSNIVIDEIQAYDPALLAYISIGLKQIQELGGKYLIMSATIPPFVQDLFREQGLEIPDDVPEFYDEDLQARHCLKNIEKEINIDDILAYQHTRTLIVCNTVKKAQKIYQELNKLSDQYDIHLLHSRLIKKHRNQLESEIIDCGQNKQQYNKPQIWISTQIVEASLDIDFDLLFTELSDLSGLFQRMGRCHRKRNNTLNQENVIVFSQGKNYVTDPILYKLGQTALASYIEHPRLITERDKTKLINDFYTTDNLKESNYLKTYYKRIEYLDHITRYHQNMSEYETIKLFRNINEIDVVPKIFYPDIQGSVQILKSDVSSKSDKILARNQINEYTLSISTYQFKNHESSFDIIMVNDYEKIIIGNIDYKSEIGFSAVNQQSIDGTTNFI